jgi:hypothetical protein
MGLPYFNQNENRLQVPVIFKQATRSTIVLNAGYCRHLWNRALADRKNAWEREGITRSYGDQAAFLVFEKQSNPYLNAVHPQVEQDVSWRTDLQLWPMHKVGAGSSKQEAATFRVGRKSL